MSSIISNSFGTKVEDAMGKWEDGNGGNNAKKAPKGWARREPEKKEPNPI